MLVFISRHGAAHDYDYGNDHYHNKAQFRGIAYGVGVFLQDFVWPAWLFVFFFSWSFEDRNGTVQVLRSASPIFAFFPVRQVMGRHAQRAWKCV